ncbi:hypothetical protein ACQQ2Q_18800 [Agrobacterium sp. ES01]|uniref:hypothetical protein n=1 Tax=Agrobacterium sp. ES01 TaxID=3420714 RepID=UPI003D0B305E
MVIKLTTLGTCRLQTEDGQALNVPTMSLKMLAYLCDLGMPVARRELSLFLWPIASTSAATNLRSTIRRLLNALPANCKAVLKQEQGYVSIDRRLLIWDVATSGLGSEHCDLGLACDALSLRFLPNSGGGNSHFDHWVRDVRARLLGQLRSACLKIKDQGLDVAMRADLKRASMLLLELDADDEEIRTLLIEPHSLNLPVRRDIESSKVNSGTLHAQTKTAVPILPAVALPRIALLPPETTSSANRSRSIGNALIEELTINLCACRTLSVVAPYTCERLLSSNDKAEFLKQHHVSYVLDTRRSGEEIFVQLIFMPRDEILWAHRFKLTSDALNDNRTAIAAVIQKSIVQTVRTNSPLSDDFNKQPSVYYSYLLGLQNLSTLTLPSVRRARNHFKTALKDDAKFGPALAGLSRSLTMEWLFTARDDNTLLEDAECFSRTAVDFSPEFSGGFRELGVSQLYLGKLDASLQSLQTARDISPHYADALYSHADTLVHASEPRSALDQMRLAMELNPLSPDTYFWTAAAASYFLEGYSQALGYIDEMKDSKPVSRLAAACWAMLGDTGRARACRLRFLKENPDFNLARWLKMVPHKEPWQTELYMEGLRKAGF